MSLQAINAARTMAAPAMPLPMRRNVPGVASTVCTAFVSPISATSSSSYAAWAPARELAAIDGNGRSARVGLRAGGAEHTRFIWETAIADPTAVGARKDRDWCLQRAPSRIEIGRKDSESNAFRLNLRGVNLHAVDGGQGQQQAEQVAHQ